MRRNVKKSIALLLALIMLFTISINDEIAFAAETGSTITVGITGTYGQTEARSMLAMINEFRTGNDAWVWNTDNETKTTYTDLASLKYDYNLERIAMQRAMELVVAYSHTRPNGTSCFTAYTGSYSARGENIAIGTGNMGAARAFALWQETNENYSGQGHRRSMLSPNFGAVGIAHVLYNGCHYWVQEFGNAAVDTTSVQANDSETVVDIEILRDTITSLNVTATPMQYHFTYGEEDGSSLPELQAALRTSATWSYAPAGSIVISPEWTIADITIVDIVNGKITAKAVGSTTLTTTILEQTVEIPVTVNPASMTGAAVTLSADAYTYDGTAKTPQVLSVVLNNKILDAGTDYTVTYESNQNAGTAKAIVIGQGNYTGTEEIAFAIYPKSIETALIGDIGQQKYIGNAIKPELQVTLDGTALVCNQDYTVEYTDNDKPGTAEVTIAGKGNYIGNKTTSFDIVCEHQYISNVTTAATCTNTGTLTYICKVCGDTYTEVISMVPHTPEEIPAAAATCTGAGLTAGSKCSVCNTILKAQKEITATGHQYAKTVQKATTTKKSGKIVEKCKVCGNIKSTTVIAYPKTITLSSTSYTYNGKVKHPSVTVKDSKGKKVAASNYKVTYSSGCKNPGQYTVTIQFKGNYSGTVKKTFKVLPKGISLSGLTAKSKGFTVKWKKQTAQTSGYQIQYAANSKFKNAKTVTMNKNTTTSSTIKKLTAKKKYYVRVRTYKTVKINGKSQKLYSAWSKVKTVTTKK